MKLLFIILIFQLFILIRTQTATPASVLCNTQTNKVMQCDSQKCDTILTCIPGIATPHEITKCSNSTPYCNIGLHGDYCSDVPDSSHTHCYQIGTFTCTKPGFYPSK